MLQHISSSAGMLLALGQVVASMNLSYVGNCTDAKILSNVAYFNSTSTTNFTMQQLTGNEDSWYFHLALTTGEEPIMIYRLLSVPESFMETKAANETGLCAYTIEGQKKTPKATEGSNTCSGVVSSKCEGSFSGFTGVGPDGVCPMPDSGDCNSDALYSTTIPLKLVKNTCNVKGIPGLDVPKGYATFELLGVSFGGADDPGSFKNYDTAVTESFPTFLALLPSSIKTETTIEGQEHATYSQSVCAVPNKVLNGSRSVDSSGRKRLAPAVTAVMMSLFSLLL